MKWTEQTNWQVRGQEFLQHPPGSYISTVKKEGGSNLHFPIQLSNAVPEGSKNDCFLLLPKEWKLTREGDPTTLSSLDALRLEAWDTPEPKSWTPDHLKVIPTVPSFHTAFLGAPLHSEDLYPGFGPKTYAPNSDMVGYMFQISKIFLIFVCTLWRAFFKVESWAYYTEGFAFFLKYLFFLQQ